MIASHIETLANDIAAAPDRSWRGLYRVGAVSAVLYALLIIVPIALINAAPQPPLTGGAALLDYIAVHKLVYLIELVSFVGLSLPAMIVFLALYMALQGQDKSYAALGALIGVTSEIMALAYNSSPPSLHTGLLYLSDQYVAAASDVQRANLAIAAEALMAASNTINPAGILTALGMLIVSLVMRKGAFPRGTAYLGIATGAIGIVSEAFRNVIGAGYYAYGLLLPAWFLAVGWALYHLGRDAKAMKGTIQ